MAAQSRFRILNDSAVSQHDRQKGAPTPERFKVDGRSLAQLLAFGARYGDLINFYDLQDRPDGTWSEFFARDPAVAHALHASLDLERIERLIQGVVQDLRRDAHRRGLGRELERLLRTVERLLRILDRDHGRTGGRFVLPGGPRRAPASAALRPPVDRLRRHLGEHWLERSLEDRLADAASGWLADLADMVEELGGALIDELRRGVEVAESEILASLASGGHSPQAALYNAFVLQFIEARASLNHFPRRLVDFYYDEVLEQSERAAEPDQVFLTFTAADPTKPASVPRGAQFPAGADPAGQPINYAAQVSLDVAPISVEQLSVHSVAYSAPPGGNLIRSGLLSGVVEHGSDQGFPLFGAPDAGEHGALSLEPADIGFTVATPTLLAQGGERTIEIGFMLSARQMLAAQLALGAAAVESDLQAFASNAATLIQANFHLYYSTAGGWVKVETFEAATSIPPGRPGDVMLVLSFSLPADAPPLVATSVKPAPGSPPPALAADAYPQRTDDPAVVCAVQLEDLAIDGAAGAAPNPFTLLSQIQIDEVQVSVTVKGLADLKLNTPTGAVDLSQTFAVFGVPPVQGSVLEIQAPELFVKPVTALSVSIAWTGLPVTSTGFAGYYQGYALDADGEVSPTPLFDNTSFRVGFSVRNPGLWDVVDLDVPLFQTLSPPSATGSEVQAPPDPAAPLAPVSVLVAAPEQHEAPDYYTPTASALLLTLTDPPYAFGDVLFTPNVMAAASAMTAASIAAASSPPPSAPPPAPPVVPNPPWRPMAAALTLSYSARSSYPVGEAASQALESGGPLPGTPSTSAPIDFWQIGTFGQAKTPDSDPGGGVNLIPNLDADAALYIQLSAKAPTVSLLFVLTAGPNGWWDREPSLAWEQRVGGRWKPATVLGDTTNSFSNSGIVTLALETGKEVADKPRIRVTSAQVDKNAPNVKQVIANAVAAKWVGPGGASDLGKPLAPQTISKSVAALNNVGSILQPMESFGGSPPLEGQDLQMWLAERLRHKEFGIDGWDYARLALEESPTLWQAIVVPATDGTNGRPATGHVWVVVVAGPSTPDIADPTVPTVDFTAMSSLGEMLAARISPFVRLSVTNPPYLRLKVRAQCVFTDEDTPAFWSQRLEAELIRWLSPWPPADLGLRPTDYYTEQAIAQFIRHRPYVRGVPRLSIDIQPPTTASTHYYLTSAQSHAISGTSQSDQPDPEPLRRARSLVRGSI